jgi:hypothetical protein
MSEGTFAVWLLKWRNEPTIRGQMVRQWIAAGAQGHTHQEVRACMEAYGIRGALIWALNDAVEEWGSL